MKNVALIISGVIIAVIGISAYEMYVFNKGVGNIKAIDLSDQGKAFILAEIDVPECEWVNTEGYNSDSNPISNWNVNPYFENLRLPFQK